jgi:hypothetical protein
MRVPARNSRINSLPSATFFSQHGIDERGLTLSRHRRAREL